MTLYRKKPIEVEAVQFGGSSSWQDAELFAHKYSGDRKVVSGGDRWGRFIEIDTLEGRMRVSESDWIIKGVAGEIYPCKDEIFQQTYEKVT